jgi:hypothetical protein
VKIVCGKLCIYWNNEELSGLLGHEMRRIIGALDVECERERRNVSVRGEM